MRENEPQNRSNVRLQFGFRSSIVFFTFTIFVITTFYSMKETNRGPPDDLKAAVMPVPPTKRKFDLPLSSCNLFLGKWVHDNNSNPPYRDHQCSFMEDGVACEKYGRKNLTYQYWRWQPYDCDLPRFNAMEMLDKLRNRRLVYVGDSLNRNQWVSMICLIESSIPDRLKYVNYNRSLASFKALEYNVSIDFYWSPMLVESNGDDPWNHRVSDRIIRAKAIEKHASHWSNADILVFNSYIWWGQPILKILYGSVEDAEEIYKDAEKLSAYEMALKTWSEWLENHVNQTKTRVFFVGLSPTHLTYIPMFLAQEWGKPKGQNCFGETEPIFDEGYSGMDSDSRMMRLVEAAVDRLRSRGFRAQILNITQLSEYRKDAHPTMHRKFWDPITEDQQFSKPNLHADCIHWCLPGVPDVWNQLLSAYLLYF